MISVTEVTDITPLIGGPGKPNYLTKRLKWWFYQKFINNPSKMTDAQGEYTKSMVQHCGLPALQVKQLANDGTVKLSLGNISSGSIESVFIPKARGQGTVCISTQLGCPVKCRFCETGKLRGVTSLRSGEILSQLVSLGKLLRLFGYFVANRVKTIVLMGMGEPLANYSSTIIALKEMVKRGVFGVTRRNIVLSTSGVVPSIHQLSKDFPLALAVSLHSSTDILRHSLVPVGKLKVAEILSACKSYTNTTKRPSLTLEYCLIGNVNDYPAEAHHLSSLLRTLPVKLNVIPLNSPIAACPFGSSGSNETGEFCGVLKNNGISCNMRGIRGKDISASCGQLARKC